jgi:NAD(P)-dependent dehydrogenase (short-subunit alcohol dehydrogenase family)
VAKVLIIGASRGIGLEAVKAALEAGHSVRALARSARRIRLDHSFWLSPNPRSRNVVSVSPIAILSSRLRPDTGCRQSTRSVYL